MLHSVSGGFHHFSGPVQAGSAEVSPEFGQCECQDLQSAIGINREHPVPGNSQRRAINVQRAVWSRP